jgi:polyphosphate kinase
VIREGLQPYFEDNSQAWVMGPDGNYERLRPRKGAKGRSAQEELLVMLATPS